ncbi:hypothetical protein MRB53_009898 [Persea americana]|uniref:Uncharacterized protein n=1 Tax=Persea americana TaxID=3435 RepID=A0ACC2LRH9_PERAE|nr:hypothetical protein MRB53_009898 [Persea americana]
MKDVGAAYWSGQGPCAAAIAADLHRRGAGSSSEHAAEADSEEQPVEANEEARLLEGVGDFRGERKELVEEKKMEDQDSGGKSADKVAAREDEGSTTPIPEKVKGDSLGLDAELWAMFDLPHPIQRALGQA